MRNPWLLLAMTISAGCGDGGGDPATPTDAPTDDTVVPNDATNDSMDDAAVDAPRPCTPVFVNGIGGQYINGTTADSRTNTSPLVSGLRTYGGPGPTRTAVIADIVRNTLAAQGVQVTTVDPGDVPHLEVVLVSQGWSWSSMWSAYGQSLCMFVPNAIGFVNLTTTSISDGEAAADVLFLVGASIGLDQTTSVNNCMTDMIPGCTFSSNATTRGACSVSTQDQLAIIASTLGCP
jgi:hypothetical protein